MEGKGGGNVTAFTVCFREFRICQNRVEIQMYRVLKIISNLVKNKSLIIFIRLLIVLTKTEFIFGGSI